MTKHDAPKPHEPLPFGFCDTRIGKAVTIQCFSKTHGEIDPKSIQKWSGILQLFYWEPEKNRLSFRLEGMDLAVEKHLTLSHLELFDAGMKI